MEAVSCDCHVGAGGSCVLDPVLGKKFVSFNQFWKGKNSGYIIFLFKS